MRIIINADDLGHSINRNNAIYGLMDDGLIRSATVMANGDGFDDAVKRSSSYPNCSFGIHLTLTEFSPLSKPGIFRKYGLLGEEGAFNSHIQTLAAIPAELMRAVQEEWQLQIQRLLDAGVRVSHLDSHHHVHTIPLLLPAIRNIADSFGIRRVRNIEYLSRRRLIQYKIWQLRISYRSRIDMPDRFTSFAFFCSNVQRFRRFRTIELMCHPGHAPYGTETRMISTDWARELRNVQLISYDEL